MKLPPRAALFCKYAVLVTYACVCANYSVVTVRRELFGGYLTSWEVSGTYEYHEDKIDERLIIDSREFYQQVLTTAGKEYRCEGEIYLNTGANVVFMDGLYVPQPSGAPLLDKRASTHWDYAGYLDYDSRRIVRNAGRIAFFDSLLAISTPCGANIFLLG